jgi:hypothetical protein
MTPRPPDPAKVAEAIRLHGEGLTTREIAGRIGVDPKTVSRWTRDQARRKGPRGYDDRVLDARILRLRDQDQRSFDAIAAETGMSRTGVRMRYYQLKGVKRDRSKG